MKALLITSLFLCLFSCNGKAHRQPAAINCEVTGDTTYMLTHSNRTAVLQLSGNNLACKFVEVQITTVVNPQLHHLAFEVHFQPKGKDKKHLGSFSLYPANNPGRFIVPTKGLINEEGNVIVTMTSPDSLDKSNVSVTIKSVKLRKE